MVERLSQKMVEDEFYTDCISMDVPCYRKHDKKRGYFLIQYSYGGMQLQYHYLCGGSASLSSGFVGAREMFTWLRNFNPKLNYKYYRGREIVICKNKKEREKRGK